VQFENGVYTPWVDDRETASYYYTSENKSDVVLYSVEINVPNGLGSDSGVPQAGIILTDGTAIPNNIFDGKTVVKGSYKSIQIGISQDSLVSHCGTVNSMSRNLDYPTHRWTMNLSDHNCGFKTGTTKILTVALYKDTLYLYVDNAFIYSYAVTDSAYFNTGFSANSTYRFGVQTTNNLNATSPVSFKVLKELYGNEAKAEIESKYIYSISCNGTTTSTFGNTTASNTVVYSIDVNTVNGIPTPWCNASGHIGIAISNAATPTDVMTIGFSQHGISSACKQGMYRKWDGTDRYGSAVNTELAFAGSNNAGGTLKSGKLTVVIYNNTLYVYAGATTEKFVNSASLVNGGGWTNLASFTANSQWTVGVGATHIFNINGTINGNALDYSAWGITIMERNRLYGDEAIEYIKANYSANITVS
jgi:hypothetical protein